MKREINAGSDEEFSVRYRIVLRDALYVFDAPLPARQDVIQVEVEAVQLIEIGGVGERLKVELGRREDHEHM